MVKKTKEVGAVFKRIDHIELLTAHPERVLQFYTEILASSAAARPRALDAARATELVYLDLGGTTVELMTYPETTPAPSQPGEHSATA